MKAIVSGQSATAIYIENDKIYSISLNSPETWVEKNKSDIPFLFAEAEDIFELENVSKSQVLEKLKIAWAQDRSMHLILILLVPSCINRHNASEDVPSTPYPFSIRMVRHSGCIPQ